MASSAEQQDEIVGAEVSSASRSASAMRMAISTSRVRPLQDVPHQTLFAIVQMVALDAIEGCHGEIDFPRGWCPAGSRRAGPAGPYAHISGCQSHFFAPSQPPDGELSPVANCR